MPCSTARRSIRAASQARSTGRVGASVAFQDHLNVIIDTLGRLRQVLDVDHEYDRCVVSLLGAHLDVVTVSTRASMCPH